MERFYVESQSLPILPNASNFVSGHRFDSVPPFVRLPQMQSVFLVCLSGSVHEIDMSRHGQNSHEVLQQLVMLCCSQTFAPVAARFLPRPAKTVTKYFQCHLRQTDKWRNAVETGTDMNRRKRHLQICVKSRFHITSSMKNYLSQNHKNNVQIYDTSIVPQKRDVLRHLF